MIQYYCKQNKNEKSPTFGKWYAYPKAISTLDLEGLASHMTEHNTPFSKGTIYGVLCDMVKCIKESGQLAKPESRWGGIMQSLTCFVGSVG